MEKFMLEVGENKLWNWADVNTKLSAFPSAAELDEYITYMNSERGYPVDAIRNLRKKFREEANVDLELCLYEGFSSPLSTGRPSDFNSHDVAFRSRRIIFEPASYMIALNGGISYDNAVKLDKELILALDELEKNSVFENNKVTILRPELHDIMSEVFPGLDLMASCFQVLDVENPDGYAEMLEKYDYVVPINQHNDPLFLSQFGSDIGKMVLFLDHVCGKTNLHECYEHVVMLDKYVPEGKYGDIKELDEEKFRIPVGQYEEKYPSQNMETGCVGGELYKRKEELIQLISMGVRNFKIPRDIDVKPVVIDTLIDAINSSRIHTDLQNVAYTSSRSLS